MDSEYNTHNNVYKVSSCFLFFLLLLLLLLLVVVVVVVVVVVTRHFTPNPPSHL